MANRIKQSLVLGFAICFVGIQQAVAASYWKNIPCSSITKITFPGPLGVQHFCTVVSNRTAKICYIPGHGAGCLKI